MFPGPIRRCPGRVLTARTCLPPKVYDIGWVGVLPVYTPFPCHCKLIIVKGQYQGAAM